jgi:hypothetical protein
MRILLFSHELEYARAAVAAGVSQVIVDWEHAGKERRQRGHDTEINRGTEDDLEAAVAAVPGRVICRINNTPERRDLECERAIELGASEIWLPMLRSPHEAEEVLRVIDGRARLGVQAETRESMELGRELASLPISRVYVGLLDYRIDNGHAGLFDPIVDGTLERFREHWDGDFGFAGVTVPEGGAPVPQALLMAAMARLGCGFGVARRCFRKEIGRDDLPVALARIGARYAVLLARTPQEVDEDFRTLASLLQEPTQHGGQERACAR